MGDAKYSVSSRLFKAKAASYESAPVEKLFSQTKERKIHQSMDPKGISIREARDSVANPNSVPIILALDITGSMQQIPIWLVREGLPKVMERIMQKGIPDPALLFMAVGDAETDHYPLQVGQFESDDNKLDHWLQSVYLEGGGGSNAGESYLLAWYFAAFHTVTDSFEKRSKKGILFTTGDEPCLNSLTKSQLTKLMGDAAPQYEDFTAQKLLEKAKEKWEVYHLHVMQGSAGQRSLVYWKQLLDDHCIQVDNYEDLPEIMSQIIYDNYKKSPFINQPTGEYDLKKVVGEKDSTKETKVTSIDLDDIKML